MAQRIVAAPLDWLAGFFLLIRVASHLVDAWSGGLINPEEPRSRPSRAGHLAGNNRQRPPILSAPQQSVLGHKDLMGLTAPLADEPSAGSEADTPGPGDIGLGFDGERQLGQSPLCDPAQAPKRAFLQFPGDAKFEEVPAQKFRGMAPPGSPPCAPKVDMGHVLERSDFAGERLRSGFMMIPHGLSFRCCQPIGLAVGMGIEMECKTTRLELAQCPEDRMSLPAGYLDKFVCRHARIGR